MNDLILYRLKKVKQLQNNMKLNDLDCKAKSRKILFFSKHSLPFIFLRNRQYIFINKRSCRQENNTKCFFLKNIGFLFEKKINLNSLKSKVFPIQTSDKIPTLESKPNRTANPIVFDTSKPTQRKYKLISLNTKYLH